MTSYANAPLGQPKVVNLSDVFVQKPQGNECLVFNAQLQKFENEAIYLGNGGVRYWNSDGQLPEGVAGALEYTRLPGDTYSVRQVAAGGGGGGGVTTFAALTDVSVPTIPFLGQAIHYDGSKWTQASEMKVDPTTKQISLQTTGAVAIVGAGAVGMQSTGGELAIASAGDASVTSALGNVNITSLTNAVQIGSTLDTTITSDTGNVKLKANDGQIEIVAPNNRIQVIGGGGVTQWRGPRSY